MGQHVHTALKSAGFEADDLYVEQSADGRSVTLWSTSKEIVRDAAGTLEAHGFRSSTLGTGTDEMIGFWKASVVRG